MSMLERVSSLSTEAICLRKTYSRADVLEAAGISQPTQPTTESAVVPALVAPTTGLRDSQFLPYAPKNETGAFFYRFLRLAKTFCGKKIISASFFP